MRQLANWAHTWYYNDQYSYYTSWKRVDWLTMLTGTAACFIMYSTRNVKEILSWRAYTLTSSYNQSILDFKFRMHSYFTLHTLYTHMFTSIVVHGSRNLGSIVCPNLWQRMSKAIRAGCPNFVIFTALHGMQSRYSDGNSVRPSVCPSVCQTRALWQKGRKLCLDFYIIWKNIYPSFLRRRIVGGGRPLLPEILGQSARVGAKSPILNR